jgi:hypothetical protein
MSRYAPLERLKSMLYPMVQQNEVAEALLIGPAVALGTVDGALDMLLYDGRFLDPGTVTIQADLVTLTQAADPGESTIDWTRRYRVGDEVIIGGSIRGNTGIRTIASVSPLQMTVTVPYAATESGLLYGKPTYELLNRARELLLFPGGYETDTELRAFLTEWITVLQQRGSRRGVESEMNRVTNTTTTAVLGTSSSLTFLGTGVSYTHSTTSLDGTGWSTAMVPGLAITLLGSSKDSNGRYTVYGVSGSSVQIGHRAARSSFFSPELNPGSVEIHIREDRSSNLIGIRAVNTSGSSASVGITLTVTGATFPAGQVVSGSATVSRTSTTATVAFTPAAGATAEVLLQLQGPTDTTTFVSTITGSPSKVMLGELSLCPTSLDGVPTLASPYPWRWGGVIRTGLRSASNESGLTVYRRAYPGWFLGVGSIDSSEEDSYTMTSPDEYIVVEADHRNSANYTEQELAALVRDVLLPADVDGILGLL